MANLSLTMETANWLTDSVLEYNAELWKDISASFEDVKKQLGAYKSYAAACKDRLKKQRDYYCSGKLSFAIVRLLHKEYSKEHVAGESCIVYGRVLHSQNALSPHNISEDDRQIYVEILVDMALDAPRTEHTKEELYEKFSAIMDDNYPAHDIKKVVIDLCFHLKWKSDYANYLLLRIGNDGLCANDPIDMIDRFLLDVKEATMGSKEVLINLTKRHTRGNNTQVRNEEHPAAGQTTTRFNELGRIIANESGLPLDKQIKQYAKVLKENKAVFDGYSESARKKLIHILLLAAQNTGWKIHGVELRLGNMIKSGDLELKDYRDGYRMRNVHLSDYCNVILHNSISLDRQPDCEKLYLAICSGYAKTEQDLFKSESIEFAYNITDDSLAYPAVGTDGKLYRVSAKHLLAAMSGETPVTKTDILFALYLLFRSVSDQKDHYSAYRAFTETAKNVLEELYMPPFYHVHVLEFTLSSAILSEQAQDIFEDITYALPPLEPVTGIKYKPKKANSKKERDLPTFENHAPIPASYNNLWGRIVSHAKYATVSSLVLLPKLPQSELDSKGALFQTVYKKHGEIYEEMARIANLTYRIWKDTGFDHIKILFPEKSGEIVVSPSREKDKNAKGEKLYAIQNIVLDAKLSETMNQLLHGKDDNNAMLQAFYLPARGGRIISLAQLAEDFENELLLHDTWNRAYRRKAILAVILSMVLGKYGISLGNITELYNAAERKREHPYEISFKGSPTIRLNQLDQTLLLNFGTQEAVIKTELDEEKNAESDEEITLEECYTYSDNKLEVVVAEATEACLTESKVAHIEEYVAEASAIRPEEAYSDAWMIKEGTLLSLEEERAIALCLRSEDPSIRDKAKNKLFLANLRLVAYIARKIPCQDQEEKISAGYVGLAIAIDRFDPERGYRFSTYAYNWIYRYIRNAVNSLRFSDGKLPAEMIQQIYRIENEIERFKKANGTNPTIYDIQNALSLSPERIKVCLQHAVGTVSLNNKLDVEDEDSVEVIDNTEDKGANFESKLLDQTTKERVPEQIKRLTSREIRFLQLRGGQLQDENGIYRSRSFLEIAQILGMFKESGEPDIHRAIRLYCNIQRKLSHPDYEELRILAE